MQFNSRIRISFGQFYQTAQTCEAGILWINFTQSKTVVDGKAARKWWKLEGGDVHANSILAGWHGLLWDGLGNFDRMVCVVYDADKWIIAMVTNKSAHYMRWFICSVITPRLSSPLSSEKTDLNKTSGRLNKGGIVFFRADLCAKICRSWNFNLYSYWNMLKWDPRIIENLLACLASCLDLW